MPYVNGTNNAKPTKPWFREPWPWLLMLGPAVVVFAGFITLAFAIETHDGLVSDDYYKRGLAVNKTIERDAVAAARDYQAVANTEADGSGQRRLHIEFRGASPASLRIAFSHATRSGKDQKITLVPNVQQHYSAPLPPLDEGKWYVTLDDAVGDWRLVTEIVVRDGVVPAFRLNAAAPAEV